MACCILLVISSVFCENIIFGILAIIFVQFGFFEVFRAFFSSCFEISIWNVVYTCSTWCYTSSSSFIPIGTLWPTLEPKIGQSHLSAFMALRIKERAQIWYKHLYCECLDPYWFSSSMGNFWPSGGQKHLKGGVSRAPSRRKVFRTFFVHVSRYEFETWYIHLVGGVTCQVRVSFQSGHFDLLYSPK